MLDEITDGRTDLIFDYLAQCRAATFSNCRFLPLKFPHRLNNSHRLAEELGPPHFIHGAVSVLHDMELVKNNPASWNPFENAFRERLVYRFFLSVFAEPQRFAGLHVARSNPADDRPAPTPAKRAC